jgi:hypothetical protein
VALLSGGALLSFIIFKGVQMRSALFASLLLVVLPVSAAPVTWTFQNVVFVDGGSAAGSFIYDAATDIFSDIDITTTAGSVLSDAAYGISNPYLSSATTISYGTTLAQFVYAEGDLTGTQSMLFSMDGLLTNQGGSITISDSAEVACINSNCGIYAASRIMVSGHITAVPIPAAVWLFGSGLAGLGWFRRKTA